MLKLFIIIVIGIGVTILLYGWWDTRRFSVRMDKIVLDRLPEDFDGFTILHISDLHNKEYGRDGMSMKKAIEGLSFDIIAFTGDILDHYTPRKREKGYRCAETLSALAPVYFVQGNHEWLIGSWEKTKADLTERGFAVLDNEKVTLYRGTSSMDICGIMEETTEEQMIELICTDSFTILLSHRPERIDEYARTGADLVLSGHAHGGQVRLFGHGLFSPDQGILPRYTSGLYTKGRTKLYVSRGAGTHCYLPPRIFNRPEINLIQLKTPSR